MRLYEWIEEWILLACGRPLRDDAGYGFLKQRFIPKFQKEVEDEECCTLFVFVSVFGVGMKNECSGGVGGCISGGCWRSVMHLLQFDRWMHVHFQENLEYDAE